MYWLCMRKEYTQEEGAMLWSMASPQLTLKAPYRNRSLLPGAVLQRLQKLVLRQALGMRQVACSGRSTALCWPQPAAPVGSRLPHCSAPAQPSAAQPPPALPVPSLRVSIEVSPQSAGFVLLGPRTRPLSWQ